MFGSWLARTDPKDVARVESKTVIVTKNQRDTIPIPAGGVKSQLGSWMSEPDWHKAREDRFPGCMAGRSTDPYDLTYLGHFQLLERVKIAERKFVCLGHQRPFLKSGISLHFYAIGYRRLVSDLIAANNS